MRKNNNSISHHYTIDRNGNVVKMGFVKRFLYNRTYGKLF
jgi:hypothetical protein